MELWEHQSTDENERTLYLLRVARAERQQDVTFPLARITTCGTLTIEVLRTIRMGEGGQPEAVYGPPNATLLAKKGASTAFTLLALLASQPGNFATKDWLSEKLGHLPKDEDEKDLEDLEGLKRVDNVVSHLRHLLYPARSHESWDEKLLRRRLVAYQRASGETGPGYRLVGMPLVWLDVEEIGTHIKRARLLEQFGKDCLFEWRAAYDLGMQGRFLPNETYSDWAEWRRQEIESYLWDCVQALWHRYVEQREAGETEALRVLRDYWQSHITNEDALRPLLELLGKREWYGQAEEYYQQLCTVLAAEGKLPDRRTQEVIDFLRAAQIQRKQTLVDSVKENTNIPPTPVLFASQQHIQPAGFPHIVTQGIMGTTRVTEGNIMDQLRRQILAQMLKGTGGAFLASQNLTLASELTEQLVKVPMRLLGFTGLSSLLHPEEILSIYAVDIPIYWRLYFDGHLIEVNSVLPACISSLSILTSQSSSYQKQAASLASKACQLACMLALQQQDCSSALTYADQALLDASIAEDAHLLVTSLIRKALVYRYLKRFKLMLETYQEADQYSKAISPLLQGRLYTGLAEAHSNFEREHEAQRLLERAYTIFPDNPRDDPNFSYTHFKLPQGFEAVMYLNLKQADKAWNVLSKIDASVPTAICPDRVELSIDQARASLLLGNLEQSCKYVEFAATSASALGSHLRYNEAYNLYQQIQMQWPREQQVKALAGHFQ